MPKEENSELRRQEVREQEKDSLCGATAGHPPYTIIIVSFKHTLTSGSISRPQLPFQEYPNVLESRWRKTICRSRVKQIVPSLKDTR